MMPKCADCGNEVYQFDASYTAFEGGASRIYHSQCGDPFGLKAKDAEIERLRAGLQLIADQLDNNWTKAHARKVLGIGKPARSDVPATDVRAFVDGQSAKE